MATSTVDGLEQIETPTANLRVVASFQLAGLFFLLFYYSELLLVSRREFLPSLPLRVELDALLLTIYEASNAIQRSLGESYANVIVAAFAGIVCVYSLLALTCLRRGDFLVIFRAFLFMLLGLSAIPFVLLFWTLRWLPEYMLGIAQKVFSFVASWVGPIVSFLAPVFGYVMLGALALALLVLLLSTKMGRILLFLGATIAILLLVYAGGLQDLLREISEAGKAIGNILSYPLSVIGYVFSFLFTVLTFLVSAGAIISIVMLVLSQFGHIFLDSLFDARNVRRSARAAGRFLVGIGFLASTILLCLPENKLASAGAIEAVQSIMNFVGSDGNSENAAAVIDATQRIYMLFIPDSVETSIVKAFSYGYPPSLELILLTIACGIAFLLISLQIFGSEVGGEVAIAFYPRELFFLLVYAALILLAVMAASDSEIG